MQGSKMLVVTQESINQLTVLQEDFKHTVMSVAHQTFGQSFIRQYRSASSLAIRTQEENQVSNLANEYPDVRATGVNKVYNSAEPKSSSLSFNKSDPECFHVDIQSATMEVREPAATQVEQIDPLGAEAQGGAVRLRPATCRMGCGNTWFTSACKRLSEPLLPAISAPSPQVLNRLPMGASRAWQTGFVYKGLYLRCLSGTKARTIKEQIETVAQLWQSVGQLPKPFSTFQPSILFHVFPALQMLVDLGGMSLYVTPVIANEDPKGLDSITKTMFTDSSVLPGWSTLLRPLLPSTGFLHISRSGAAASRSAAPVGLSLLFSVATRTDAFDPRSELTYKFCKSDQGHTECTSFEEVVRDVCKLVPGLSFGSGAAGSNSESERGDKVVDSLVVLETGQTQTWGPNWRYGTDYKYDYTGAEPAFPDESGHSQEQQRASSSIGGQVWHNFPKQAYLLVSSRAKQFDQLVRRRFVIMQIPERCLMLASKYIQHPRPLALLNSWILCSWLDVGVVSQIQQQTNDLWQAILHLRHSLSLEQQYASRLNQVVSNLVSSIRETTPDYQSLASKVHQTAALNLGQLMLWTTKIGWPSKQDLKGLFRTSAIKKILDLAITDTSIFLQVFSYYFGVDVNRDLEIALCLDKFSLAVGPPGHQGGHHPPRINFNWSGPRAFCSWSNQLADGLRKHFEEVAPTILTQPYEESPTWLYLGTTVDFRGLTAEMDRLISRLNPPMVALASMECFGSSELIALHISRVLIEALRGSPQQADPMASSILEYSTSIGVVALEDCCSLFVLKGLCLELKKELPDKFYLLALRLAIQIGGNPIARGSSCHPILLFLVWRLGLRMRLAGLTQEYEFFDEMFDACLLEMPRCKLTQFMDCYSEILPREVQSCLQSFLGSSGNKQDKKETDHNNSDRIIKESNISVSIEGKVPDLTSLKDWVNSMRVLSADESPNLVAKTDSAIIGCPFSHWSSHRWAFKTKAQIAESAAHNLKKQPAYKKPDLDPNMLAKAKQEQEQYIINSLGENTHLVFWLFENLPCFGPHRRKLWAVNTVKLMLEPIEELFKMEAFFLSRELSDVGAILGTSLHNLADGAHPDKWQSFSLDAHSNERKLGITKAAKKEALDALQKLIASFRVPMTEGSIYSWGSNSAGQLGNSASSEGVPLNLTTKPFTLYYPRTVLPLKNLLIRQVACGHMHSVSQLESGLLMSWGCNQFGKLGLGEGFPRMVPVPAPMIQAPRDVVLVSCGNEHSAIVTSEGKLYTWGQGEGGLLGLGDLESRSLPTLVSGLDELKIKQISCGGLHTLALCANFEVYSWGRGEGGQLGLDPQHIERTKDGDAYITKPRRIDSLKGIKVVEISAGEAHSVCLDYSGIVRVWGFSSSGQLGNGASATDDNIFSTAMQVFCPSELKFTQQTPVSHVYAGKTSTFIQTSETDIYGCGSNDLHQLGLPQRFRTDGNNASERTEVLFPLKIDALTALGKVEFLNAGSVHSLAVCRTPNSSAQVLAAWGSNRQGQLGIGKQDPNGCLPTILRRFLGSPIKSVSCGAYHSVAVVGKTLYPANRLVDERQELRSESEKNLAGEAPQMKSGLLEI